MPNKYFPIAKSNISDRSDMILYFHGSKSLSFDPKKATYSRTPRGSLNKIERAKTLHHNGLRGGRCLIKETMILMIPYKTPISEETLKAAYLEEIHKWERAIHSGVEKISALINHESR